MNTAAAKPEMFVSWSTATVAQVEVIVSGDLGNWWFSLGLDKKTMEVTVDPAWFSADRITARPAHPDDAHHTADLANATLAFESVKEEAVQMLMGTLEDTDENYSTVVRNGTSVVTKMPAST